MRHVLLQDFIDTTRRAILGSTGCDDASRASAGRIFDALERPAENVELTPARLPVCDEIEPALREASTRGDSVGQVAEAFRRLEPLLAWGHATPGPGASANLHTGYASTSIIGRTTGLERRGDVAIGVSLMAPHVRYPDHRHLPEEVYYVLSPGEWRRGEGEWFEPPTGGIFYNQPDIVHAMRSGDKPLLAIWFLYAAPA
jgi:quercetin dioxygenase-like cupin family protein